MGWFALVTTSAARPDGRAEMAELLALRTATRELRLHLDTLPIEYNLAVTADEFLAGKAFMLARQRYASAEVDDRSGIRWHGDRSHRAKPV